MTIRRPAHVGSRSTDQSERSTHPHGPQQGHRHRRRQRRRHHRAAHRRGRPGRRRAGRHRRGAAAGQGPRPRRGGAGRRARCPDHRHQRLRRHRRLRHRRRHLRPRAPARDEPRRPAGQERRDRPGGRRAGGEALAGRDPDHRHQPARRDVPRGARGVGLPARARARAWPASSTPPGSARSSRRSSACQRRGHPRVRPRRPRRHDGPAVALLDRRRRADHRAPAAGAGQGARGADRQRRRRGRRAAQDRVGVLRARRERVRDGRGDPARPQARAAVRGAATRASSGSTACSSACPSSSVPAAWSGSSRSS